LLEKHNSVRSGATINSPKYQHGERHWNQVGSNELSRCCPSLGSGSLDLGLPQRPFFSGGTTLSVWEHRQAPKVGKGGGEETLKKRRERSTPTSVSVGRLPYQKTETRAGVSTPSLRYLDGGDEGDVRVPGSLRWLAASPLLKSPCPWGALGDDAVSEAPDPAPPEVPGAASLVPDVFPPIVVPAGGPSAAGDAANAGADNRLTAIAMRAIIFMGSPSGSHSQRAAKESCSRGCPAPGRTIRAPDLRRQHHA
jgi:hypothetical protein